jgi:hypothetical protein
MTNHEEPGDEPQETHDRAFAPVTRDADARGRTVSADGTPVPPEEEGMSRQEDEPSGTGVPGVDVGHPDALPPDDEGVREAEDRDATR